jgi:uncharacterized glyoxalase superfamily protein PhnB
MQRIYPVLKYNDAQAAIEFLVRAFGFQRYSINEGDSGTVVHGELRFGDQVVMVGSAGAGNPVFDQGVGHTTVYVAVDEVDALHDTAKAAGAEIVMPPTDQGIWAFGTYRPELGG